MVREPNGTTNAACNSAGSGTVHSSCTRRLELAGLCYSQLQYNRDRSKTRPVGCQNLILRLVSTISSFPVSGILCLWLGLCTIEKIPNRGNRSVNPLVVMFSARKNDGIGDDAHDLVGFFVRRQTQCSQNHKDPGPVLFLRS